MEALLYLLPALGCGLMMVVMMLFVGRLASSRDQAPDRDDDVAALRAELDALQARTLRDPVDG